MHCFRSLAVALGLTILPLPLWAAPAPAPAVKTTPIQEQAVCFLTLLNSNYQRLYKLNSEAQWKAVT